MTRLAGGEGLLSNLQATASGVLSPSMSFPSCHAVPLLQRIGARRSADVLLEGSIERGRSAMRAGSSQEARRR